MNIINTISIKAKALKPIGFISDANPKTSNILNMFDPITLPIAISVSPFLTATIEVTNSGKEVPHATIVSPTKLSLIPRALAIVVALLTTKSPPTTIPIIPTIHKAIVFGIDIGVEASNSRAIADSPL